MSLRVVFMTGPLRSARLLGLNQSFCFVRTSAATASANVTAGAVTSATRHLTAAATSTSTNRRLLDLSPPQSLTNHHRRDMTSSSPTTNDVIDFERFEEIRKRGSAILLDVRNPGELQTDGVIPGSVNVPIPVFADAFAGTMDPETFQDNFGIAKPDPQRDVVVCFCKLGIRAKHAADFLSANGYTKVYSYSGIQDWMAHQQ